MKKATAKKKLKSTTKKKHQRTRTSKPTGSKKQLVPKASKPIILKKKQSPKARIKQHKHKPLPPVLPHLDNPGKNKQDAEVFINGKWFIVSSVKVSDHGSLFWKSEAFIGNSPASNVEATSSCMKWKKTIGPFHLRVFDGGWILCYRGHFMFSYWKHPRVQHPKFKAWIGRLYLELYGR